MLKLLNSSKSEGERKVREGQINILSSESAATKEKMESEKFIIELESTIRFIANALFELRDTDQLIGLVAWCKKNVKLPPSFSAKLQDISALSWLVPLTLQSQFRYEEAAKIYKEILCMYLNLLIILSYLF